MTVEEVRNLVIELDDCEKAIKQLEGSLGRLKERDKFSLSVRVGHEYEEDIISFHYIDKIYNKKDFEDFIKLHVLDKFYSRAHAIRRKINRLEEMPYHNEPCCSGPSEE